MMMSPWATLSDPRDKKPTMKKNRWKGRKKRGTGGKGSTYTCSRAKDRRRAAPPPRAASWAIPVVCPRVIGQGAHIVSIGI